MFGPGYIHFLSSTQVKILLFFFYSIYFTFPNKKKLAKFRNLRYT